MIGEYVETSTTDNNGAFTLSLDKKTYILTFDKPGYQTTTLNVDLTSATELSNNINNVELKKSLSIQVTASTLEIHDGETVSIPLTITNGGDAENISLKVVYSDGYKVSVLTTDGEQVQSIYIPSDGSISLSLKVVVPVNAVDTDLVVKATGSLETDCLIHLNVVADEGDVLSCTYPGRSVLPSDTVDYTVTLQNPFYYTETFNIDLSGLDSWGLSVKNSLGEKISSVTLNGNKSVDIQVVGDVPYNITSGEYSFIIKASASNQTYELPLSVTVAVVSAGLTVTSIYPSQSIALGKTTVYPITIENPGTKQLVNLKVLGVPSGWTVAFETSDGKQINSILVDGGSSENVNLNVTPSLSSSESNYSLTVMASGTYSSGKINLDATIGGSYGVGIDLDSLYLQTNTATTDTVNVVLTNTGYSSLTNLYLELTYPDGWTVSVSPLKVTTLAPNEKTTFVLSINAPSGTAAQDYLVDVTGVSDQISTSMQSIRVTVNVESSYSIYGIVLLLAAVGVFALLYKKLRRK